MFDSVYHIGIKPDFETHDPKGDVYPAKELASVLA